jgi:hypothetical protein
LNLMFNFDWLHGVAMGGGWYGTIDGGSQVWSTTWEPPWGYADISVIQHEMGHGFGLPHSSGDYGNVYDNAWDVMSSDRYNCAASTDPVYGCVAQHTISYHKDMLGWIPASEKYTHAGGPATITLEQLALPLTTNYKMAQIPIGGSGTHFYTLEARRLTGYDKKLPRGGGRHSRSGYHARHPGQGDRCRWQWQYERWRRHVGPRGDLSGCAEQYFGPCRFGICQRICGDHWRVSKYSISDPIRPRECR